MKLPKNVILASASPRRQQLLRQIGLSFEVRESGVDESDADGATPEEYVRKLSGRKAHAVASPREEALVIGADTIVVLDRHILNKPLDAGEALSMLSRLSGRVHEVFTGFTLVDCPGMISMSAAEVTKVRFRELDPDEIRAYVSSGAPMDKAGAYGIQDDYGAVFVDRIEGCFYNVVGFPLARFYASLQQMYPHHVTY